MYVPRGVRRLVGSLVVLVFALGLLPSPAHAWPHPTAKIRDPFRVYARAITAYAVNRVSYGLNSMGEVGVDSLGRGTFGGGVWPRGTANGYIFNSGLQVVAITSGAKSPTNPWGRDTVWSKFFDASGLVKHGEEVSPVYRSYDPLDVPIWPEYANVPDGDISAELFDPLVRGNRAASQGDAHFMSWDGNPANITSRNHPLGIVMEHRLLSWNYPSGNNDVIYLIATAYNITSTNASDYADIRPSLRAVLLQKAQDFHELNNAAFNVTLPPEGMTYDPFYILWAGDIEVGVLGGQPREAAAANLPFALGYFWRANFLVQSGWVLPPEIHAPPFMNSEGMAGIKYLKSPQGKGEIQIFSNSADPGSAATLLALANGTSSGCNHNNPSVNHVCSLSLTPGDRRMQQSALPGVLEPGKSVSIVVAYVHAAAVKLVGYEPANGLDVRPDVGQTFWVGRTDSLRLKNPPGGKGGAARFDSLAGFRGYVGPYFDYFINDSTGAPDSSSHVPLQTEYDLVPQSLLSKALVAQSIFDNKFLLPFAPAEPEFFVIPGDKQVTILWRPSASEVSGDAYAAVTGLPNLANGNPNALYDPNFRKFDVEGYRVYRGRNDSPTSMVLLAQFDYAGTIISDYGGNIFRTLGECAPELGQSTTAFCPANFPGPILPGVAATVKVDYALNSTGGSLIQVLGGQRTLLASGKLLHTAADTMMLGAYYVQLRGSQAYPTLNDTGVPFVFVDQTRADCPACGVINGVSYSYSVTAFDVNSFRSGPGSLESARNTKIVTVGSVAANFDNSFTVAPRVVGRTVRTDYVFPTLDPSTGRFSKQFPPTNSMSIKLTTFIPQLLKGTGAVGIRLDSIGKAVLNNNATTSIAPYYLKLIPATGDPIAVTANATVNATTGTGTTGVTSNTPTDSVSSTGPFVAMTFDPALVSVYGASQAGYAVNATWTMRRQRAYYTSSWGRGCANTQATNVQGFFFNITPKCYYNGPRWFSGSNETLDNPTGQNPWVQNPLVTPVANRRYSNAGKLDGVVTAHFPGSYMQIQGAGWWPVEIALAHYITAADYRVYWGAAGAVDSVVDLTHDLAIPFRTDMNNSWGFLNSTSVPQSMRYSRRDLLTVTDITCTWPLKSYRATNVQRTLGFAFDSVNAAGEVLGAPCQTPLADSTNRALAIPLENIAKPGPIAFFNDTLSRAKSTVAAPRAANDGFLMYLKGRVYLFELAGGQVPAAGTQWTLRDYVGAISGGKGDAGDLGPYRFFTVGLPFTAVGATLEFKFDVANVVQAPNATQLAKVRTVPDPYYVTSAYDATVNGKTIKFLNVPSGAKVRIHTTSGILVTELLNDKVMHDGTVIWNVRNRSNQFVASGAYFWVVTVDGTTQTGRMTVVNNATNTN